MLKLVFPTNELKDDCESFIKEHYRNDEYKISGDGDLGNADDYYFWVKEKEDSRNNVNVPFNRVPSTTFLAYDDDKLVGIIDIRHSLNDFLLQFGGHIGYSVRPSERRKGYAKEMLRLALIYCKESLNLDRVLLTCNKTNEASRKTILANGGLLENEIYTKHKERYTQRFWIKI